MTKPKQKIRVLIPVLHYPPVIGGFEVFIKEMAERLGKELPVFVVTGRVKNVQNQETQNGLKIVRTSLFKLNDLSYSSKAYVLSVLVFIFFKSWYLIKKEKINLLHCQGFFSGLIGWLLRMPYVLTIQSADLAIYHPQSPQWLINFIHYLEKKVYQGAIKCHSVSADLQNYFTKQGVENSVVIPNGVDQESFKPISQEEKNRLRQDLGFLEKEKIIISVSRLEKKNGTDGLIKALKGLQFSDYQLLIIGDGTERKYLEQLVADLSLTAHVKFLGAISHRDLPKYLQIADLFVRAPLAEGFGIVYLEAMACGLPVIGTAVGGIKDIIEDTKTGLVAQVKNSPDLANKINYFFFSNIGKILKENGLKLVQEKYSWDKIAEEIKKIYQQFRLVIAAGIYPPDIGGPATYAETLVSELPSHNFDVGVIAYSDFKKAKGKRQKAKVQVKSQNYEIIRINRGRTLFLRYFFYFWNLRKLAKGSDLIYAQCLLSSGLPTYLTGKPYIIKITGDYAWEQAQNRFGVRDSIEEFQKKKYGLARRRGGWRVELMRRLEKMVAKKAKKVIVPSEYLKKIVLGWGISEEKIKVIYNSFESGINPPAGGRENFILSAGRLEPWKGFDTLIKIMPQLPVELKLVIVGDGPEEDNLKKQIVELKLENRVELVGRVPHEQMDKYYRQAKMFVLNTAYEGLSHILLEAMASGLPIITTKVGGNPEVVSDLLVEYNNQEEIKATIFKIYNNPDLAERLVQQGHEKLKEFSFEKMVNETIKLLYEAIND